MVSLPTAFLHNQSSVEPPPHTSLARTSLAARRAKRPPCRAAKRRPILRSLEPRSLRVGRSALLARRLRVQLCACPPRSSVFNHRQRRRPVSRIPWGERSPGAGGACPPRLSLSWCGRQRRRPVSRIPVGERSPGAGGAFPRRLSLSWCQKLRRSLATLGYSAARSNVRLPAALHHHPRTSCRMCVRFGCE